MHHVLFLLICGIWGTSFILMKKAHDVFGPITIGVGRTLGGAVVLGLIWIVLRRERAALRRRDWPALLVPGLVGMAYPFAMQPYLIGRYQDSAFFGMMVSLVPLLTIAARVPMLGQYPTPRETLGVLGGLACLWFFFIEAEDHGIGVMQFLLATTVPLCYALSNTFIKRRLAHVPPVALTCTTLGLASMVLLPLSVTTEQVVTEASAYMTVFAVGAVLLLGVLGTGLATWMFYRLVQDRGPLFAGMVTYLVAPAAVIWGWVDAERVTWVQLAALAGVLAMVALVQWPARRAAAVPATQ